jgi:alpha-ketoglutarate-dependent taurine dioxygenase
MEFMPLHEMFAAEVVGVPPDLQVGDDDFHRIEAAWFDLSILLFRDLRMTPEQHIAFTRRFGPLHVMREHIGMTLPNHPEVFVVSNAVRDGRPIRLKRAGEGFHTDGEDKQIPNAESFLYTIEVTPERGDTLFVDMDAVYEVLPVAIKRQLAGRRPVSAASTCTTSTIRCFRR